MSNVDRSFSLANPHPRDFNAGQKWSLAAVGLATFLLFVALFGGTEGREGFFLYTAISLFFVGGIGFAWQTYRKDPAGIHNNGVQFFSETARGAWGWILGIVITAFYIFLYWFPEFLGLQQGGNVGLIALFDPLSYALKGQPASQWFMYGTFYTMAILIFGVKYILKYRHSRYHVIRTSSVMFFQTAFAFLIPEFMARLNDTAAYSNIPYFDFKNIWPLNYYFFDSYNLDGLSSTNLAEGAAGTGNLGLSMLVWGVALIFLISPVLTYFFGKRWYCSWVCGCGGLAETAGDPFRHLSDKSVRAWNIERWLIHSVLVFSVVMTIAVIYTYLGDRAGAGFWVTKEVFVGIVAFVLGGLAALLWARPKTFRNLDPQVKRIASIILSAIVLLTAGAYFMGMDRVFFVESQGLRKWYGFLIGAAFSGVIGVGFYPLMGSRVWCRFGCPMAAILGLQQRFFSRFRITTNGGQCISCGNCSTYCEMGIDVRSYAQRGQNIVRASCVGCGVCAAVCPRGVLSLENGPDTGASRMDEVRY